MSIRESFANLITRGEYSQMRETSQVNGQNAAHFKERCVELEAGLAGSHLDGWALLGNANERDDELSARKLKDLRRWAKLAYLKNPLINRGVNVQVDYVFGQGMTLHSPDEDVNRVLQEFWDDQTNKAELTDAEALQDKEREQQLLGEHFFVFFPNTVTGRVRVRTFDPDEIEDVLCNPEDSKNPWYYKREWNATRLDLETGKTRVERRTAYYPDWRYNPSSKPQSIGGAPVMWKQPVYHVKTGGLRRMKRGMSEVFCQLDWAKAYSHFLENRATVASALSRFVLKFKAATKAGVSATKSLLGGNPTPYAGGKTPAAGSSAVMGEGRDVEAISVKGATINPDEGRRFLLMVACGAGLPETFYGDASVGTLATATSLDRPTELMMEKRRDFWAGVLTNIALFVVLHAIRASANQLQGTITYNDTTPVIEVNSQAVEILVDYPPLIEHEVEKRVSAISGAAAHIPDGKLIAREMLNALGVKKIDEVMKDMDFGKPQPEAQSQPKKQPAEA